MWFVVKKTHRASQDYIGEQATRVYFNSNPKTLFLYKSFHSRGMHLTLCPSQRPALQKCCAAYRWNHVMQHSPGWQFCWPLRVCWCPPPRHDDPVIIAMAALEDISHDRIGYGMSRKKLHFIRRNSTRNL